MMKGLKGQMGMVRQPEISNGWKSLLLLPREKAGDQGRRTYFQTPGTSHLPEAEATVGPSGIWGHSRDTATATQIGRVGEKYSGFSLPPIRQTQQEARSPRNLEITGVSSPDMQS